MSIPLSKHSECASLLYKNSIFPKFKSRRNIVYFSVWYFEEDIVTELLEAYQIEILSKKRSGVFWKIKKWRQHPALVVGFIILASLVFMQKYFIWSIDITGNDAVSDEYTLELLEDHGIYVGAYIPKLDLKKTYNEILRDDLSFSWLSVNLRGNCAYVQVRERISFDEEDVRSKCSNVVASDSGVVTQIIAKSGMNMVSVGQAVMEGELLISGIYENKMGRTEIDRAFGEVYAKVKKEFCVKIPKVYEKKVYSGIEGKDISVKIFSKTLNIYNFSRKNDSLYDIISLNEKMTSDDGKTLPFSFSKTLYKEYYNVSYEREKEAAEVILTQELNRQISEYLSPSGELLTKDIEFSENEESFVIKCKADVIVDIAKIIEFYCE